MSLSRQKIRFFLPRLVFASLQYNLCYFLCFKKSTFFENIEGWDFVYLHLLVSARCLVFVNFVPFFLSAKADHHATAYFFVVIPYGRDSVRYNGVSYRWYIHTCMDTLSSSLFVFSHSRKKKLMICFQILHKWVLSMSTTMEFCSEWWMLSSVSRASAVIMWSWIKSIHLNKIQFLRGIFLFWDRKERNKRKAKGEDSIMFPILERSSYAQSKFGSFHFRNKHWYIVLARST